ncbi:hypothetical protein KFK09_000374 [Dendrobium nobile]|uniref:MADS-box domain-containing protein n=1 Tax=Dendrobium nobile TaxID=94219 RepID=A0A8T3CAY1_DENNO|nr:hypothetical protein KFK09_000374 [Dendrobium nobile]
MGRAKLDIKYRENLRDRRTTYMTRLKGLKKKAMELSLLCGVDILFVSFSPDLNSLEFWPEYPKEFSRIRERYLQQIPSKLMPSPSISQPSLQEEKVAIQIKLKEVRERLDFLHRQPQTEQEWLQAGFTGSIASQQQQDSHPHQQQPPPFSFSQSLPPHHATDFITPSQLNFHLQQQPYPFSVTLPQEFPFPFPQYHFPNSVDFSLPFQQDFHAQELPFPFAQSLPPHEQPSPLSQSSSPHILACLNAEDLPTSQLPSDTPLWNHSDDLNWCDSLFLDY